MDARTPDSRRIGQNINLKFDTMKKLKMFESQKVTNLNALKGGSWHFTGGTTNGHRDDMVVNDNFFCSNLDGTYSWCCPDHRA